jgi:hypothetical protein
MTICIAALCEHSKAVVVASDKMITAGFLSLEFEHPNSKAECLTNTCVGLTSGSALASVELFQECEAILQQLHSPPIARIAEQVADLFAKLRCKSVEENILRPRGLTLKDFYEAGLINRLPPDLAVRLDASIRDAKYPLEIIIAGVDSKGAHIYAVSDPGVVDCFDRLGYYAIGTGLIHALLTITASQHSYARSLNETIYLVYEAKKRAERAQGVGEATEIGFITAAGIRWSSQEEKNTLQKIYQEKSAPQVEHIQSAISQLPFKLEQKT